MVWCDLRRFFLSMRRGQDRSSLFPCARVVDAAWSLRVLLVDLLKCDTKLYKTRLPVRSIACERNLMTLTYSSLYLYVLCCWHVISLKPGMFFFSMRKPHESWLNDHHYPASGPCRGRHQKKNGSNASQIFGSGWLRFKSQGARNVAFSGSFFNATDSI